MIADDSEFTAAQAGLDAALVLMLESMGLSPSDFLVWAEKHRPKPKKPKRIYSYEVRPIVPRVQRICRTGSRPAEIVAAVRSGMNTSPELAVRFGVKRHLMSVILSKLADGGILSRGVDRHPIRWKIGPALEAAQ